MREPENKPALPWAALMKNKNLLFILGLCGILLIGLSDFFSSPKDVAHTREDLPASSVSSREASLEQRLQEMLEQVCGKGQVKVMVTLEDTGETIYAQDESITTETQQPGQENFSDNYTYKTSEQSSHLFYDSGTGQQPLVETTRQPGVQGVAVICTDGANVSVAAAVTELVSTVLDIPTNRVCVIPMNPNT